MGIGSRRVRLRPEPGNQASWLVAYHRPPHHTGIRVDSQQPFPESTSRWIQSLQTAGNRGSRMIFGFIGYPKSGIGKIVCQEKVGWRGSALTGVICLCRESHTTFRFG